MVEKEILHVVEYIVEIDPEKFLQAVLGVLGDEGYTSVDDWSMINLGYGLSKYLSK